MALGMQNMESRGSVVTVMSLAGSRPIGSMIAVHVPWRFGPRRVAPPTPHHCFFNSRTFGSSGQPIFDHAV
jgi:hypothetical protein